jgi:hypothetical protein
VVCPGRQRVRDFVQQRITNLLDRIQKCERFGKRDPLLHVVAFAKPSAGVIESERPIGQTVLVHQLPGKMCGFVKIHG